MDNTLQHFGVLGMRWGVRRGGAGPSVGLTKKRSKAFAERDIKRLEAGKHLSVGLTKKRQARYDIRDKKMAEKTLKEIDEGTIKAGKNVVNKLLASKFK